MYQSVFARFTGSAGVVTCVIARLLAFVAFLVGFGFGLIRLTLLSGERLPFFTKNFSDLAWKDMACQQMR